MLAITMFTTPFVMQGNAIVGNINLFFVLLLFSALLGYLIGSINPAYILGKVLRGIDIREHGSGNAGASNAAKVLGKPAGVITALFDMSKGVVAALISWKLSTYFQVYSFLPFIVAGAFAILGHDFPFYLNFKGGKGAATAYGLFFFSLGLLVYHGLSLNILCYLLALMCLTLIFRIIFHSFSFSAFLVYPLVILAMFILRDHMLDVNFVFVKPVFYFMVCLIAYVVIVTIITIHQHGLINELKFNLKQHKKIRLWRKVLRICGILLAKIYFWFGKLPILALLLLFLFVFMITDKLKYTKRLPSFLNLLYKKQEARVSNITLFVIDCIVVVLLFPKTIAILSITFLVFGDTMAEVIGLLLGKKKLIGSKTVEGTTACFVSCFISGIAWKMFMIVPLSLIVIGSIGATLIELIPLNINIKGKRIKLDDNLTLGIGSSIVMWFFSKLLGIPL